MLADATDPNLPLKVQSLLLLIGFIGIIAILIVLGLLISWRRYNDRLSKQRREASADLQDTWHIAAERMQADNKPDDDDDEEEDDDHRR